MNAKLLLIAISVVSFSSCSTAYKTTQTPDDVYYSPARFYDEEKRDEKKDDYADTRKNYSEDRQIRLGINDPRWRYFDNDINYNPYQYGYNYGYYYNPYYYNLPVYNPVVVTPVNPKTATPRTTNLAAYTPNYNNSNASSGTTKMSYINNPVRAYNNSNNTGSRVGNTFNKIFNSSNSNNNSSESSRTYTPSNNNNNNSSTSTSNSSSSSSSSSSTSRPARNGKN